MQQAPIVTLILGLVTAIITAVTLIATKENKISEFRQSWIDGQRADLAAAIAAAQGFCATLEAEERGRCVKRRSKGTPDRRQRGTPFSDMMLVC